MCDLSIFYLSLQLVEGLASLANQLARLGLRHSNKNMVNIGTQLLLGWGPQFQFLGGSSVSC